MWVIVTAKINDTKTRPMRINMDYVASYGPAESAPCMIIGSDGSAYPIAETPEQLDDILRADNELWATPLTMKPSRSRKK